MSGKILEEESKMVIIENQEGAGNQKIPEHQAKPEKQNGDSSQIIQEKENIKKDMKKEIKEAPVPAWRRGKQEVITQNFPIFMGVALAFGILYTFCMYKNPSGITYPIMVGGIYGVLAWMLRRLSVEWKRGSWFLIVTAVLLGIAVCRTADPLLILLIKTAEFLLVVIFVIHQFYEDREWSIGKYLSSMAVYLCCVIAAGAYGAGGSTADPAGGRISSGAGGCSVWLHGGSLDGDGSECMDYSHYGLHDCFWGIWSLLPDLRSLYGPDFRGRKDDENPRTGYRYYVHERRCSAVSVF